MSLPLSWSFPGWPSSSSSSSSSSPQPSQSPPFPPPSSSSPSGPRKWDINMLYALAIQWPFNTNFITVLQTRYIAHSTFRPTYLSPLHPSAAASFPTHPTYVVYRSYREATDIRALFYREGVRGLFRGVVPSIASIMLRGAVLSDEMASDTDAASLLSSAAGQSKQSFGSSGSNSRISRSGSSDSDDVLAVELNLYWPLIDPQRVPLATLAAYPLDHIRTLMQLTQHNTRALPTQSALEAPGSAVNYVLTQSSSSSIAVLRTLVQQYGITAVYRGVTPAIVGQSALIGSGLQLFDEVMEYIKADNAEDEADAAGVEESQRAIVFPLTIVDRLSNSPTLLSSAALFLSSWLLVFYPATVVSLHMRAATVVPIHISAEPLTLPPHPTASHHLHAFASTSPPPSSSSALPGVLATIRRIGAEQGTSGFYRGLPLHLFKVGVCAASIGFPALMVWRAGQQEDG